MAFVSFGLPILLTFALLALTNHIAEKEDWDD